MRIPCEPMSPQDIGVGGGEGEAELEEELQTQTELFLSRGTGRGASFSPVVSLFPGSQYISVRRTFHRI